MNCKYIKNLKSKNSIKAYETLCEYIFPETYVKFIIKNNGGRPEKRRFITNKGNERELKTFLSFNPDDKESIWNTPIGEKEQGLLSYVAFAVDNFGNLICFDKKNNSIIFVNHETLEIEIIADNFDEFILMLF